MQLWATLACDIKVHALGFREQQRAARTSGGLLCCDAVLVLVTRT